MKSNEEEKTTGNPTVYNRLRRYHLSCSACPPNRGENKKRFYKRSPQKKFNHVRLRKRHTS